MIRYYTIFLFLIVSKLNAQFNYPLTMDLKGQFPVQLHVEGKITEVSPGIECGVFCTSGTLKVQLKDPIQDYKGIYVYIALPCAGISSSNIGKTIQIHVKQLTIDNKECFWQSPINTIDSKNYPFYIPFNLQTGWKILD